MRSLLFIIPLILAFQVVSSQKSSPVSWTFTANVLDSKRIELSAEASMKDDWVIYSQNTETGGPIPTSFIIDGKEIVLEEKSKCTEEFDELFEVTVKKFKNKAVFSKILEFDLGHNSINGSVSYMTCDGQRCLPPTTVDFNLIINR